MSSQKPIFHIVLVEPEIPQNTGSIGRLCLATASALHLIEPLGFEISDRTLKRAGLDYWQHLKVHQYKNLEAFLESIPPEAPKILLENTGKKLIYDFKIEPGTYFFFGQETTGLPKSFMDQHPDRVARIPMFDKRVRSLNLAQTVSMTLSEGLRQNPHIWPGDGLTPTIG